MQDAQDEPLFCDRVAGLDIAKAGVEVTVRVPSDTTAGRRQQETRSFGTTRAELESLGDWLACWGVTRIGMEATGVIWGPNINELDNTQVTAPRTRLRREGQKRHRREGTAGRPALSAIRRDRRPRITRLRRIRNRP